MDFAVPAHHKQNKRKYLDLARELKNAVEHGGIDDSNYQ